MTTTPAPKLTTSRWSSHDAVFADVTRDMRIARDEMFGPVVTVTRFSGVDEAVAIANESEYGLTCAVYTTDSARAVRVARRIPRRHDHQRRAAANANRAAHVDRWPAVGRQRLHAELRRLPHVGAAVLILFVLIEARFAQTPIVPLRTFRRRSLSVANVLSTTVGLVVFGNYFFLSLYLQEVKHYSPLRAGLAFLPIGLSTFAGALMASRLVHRLGIRRQLTIAPLVTAAAVFWLSQLSAESSYFGSLFVPLLLAGASIGVTFVPMTMAATMGVPPAEAGLASGLLNTSRQLGGALGLAVLATIASAAARRDVARADAAVAALTHGYARAFLVIAAVAAGGAVTAAFLGRSAHVPSHSHYQAEPVAHEAGSATSTRCTDDRKRSGVGVE